MIFFDKTLFTGGEYKPHFEFWKQQFTEFPEPFVFVQKPINTREYRSIEVILEKEIADRLIELTKGNDTGIYVCFLTAFSVLLKKYLLSEQFIVHSPLLSANLSQSYNADIVPLPISFNSKLSLKDALNKIQTKVKDCYKFQNFPLELISTLPEMFSSNVCLEYKQIHQPIDIKGKHDFIATLERKEDEFVLQIRFNALAFDHRFINGFLHHYLRILESFSDLTTNVDSIDILSKDEKTKLLKDFNETDKAFSNAKCFHELFESQAEKTPLNPAIVFEDKTLTYKELNELSNKLANYLIEKGIKENDFVALYLKRSEFLIAGILGVLKSGAAFLPIDSAQPPERANFIIADASAKVVLTDSDFMFNIDSFEGEILALDIQLSELETSTSNPEKLYRETLPAYVIYTSGSTGLPKGVLISNASLANYVNWFTSTFEINEKDSSLLLSSVAFDLSYTALFPTLAVGGKLVLLPEAKYVDGESIIETLIAQKISFIKLTPSHFSIIANDANFEKNVGDYSLRLIVLGGEEIKPGDVDKFFQYFPTVQFVNHYGPTETTVGTIAQQVDFKSWPTFKAHPVLGSPIANSQIYIVNDQKDLMPVGATGEICVSGAGVGLAYLNQEEITKAKFITNPFDPSKKAYLTGDLGRWTYEGKIEFLGRKDHQVKIRGFRIELGEIESALQNIDGIKESAVIVKKDSTGGKSLFAICQGDEEKDHSELKSQLKAVLPDYMIPAQFVFVAEFPLTLNGKIDRKKLTTIIEQLEIKKEFYPPVSPTEILLADTWQEVLKIERISVKDNFFEIGGDSIKAIQIASKIYQQGYQLEVKDIFEFPTIFELAKELNLSEKVTEQGLVKGTFPLTHYQNLYIDGGEEKSQKFYKLEFSIPNTLQTDKIEVIALKIIEHHDVLRTKFYNVGVKNIQEISGNLIPFIQTIEIRSFEGLDHYIEEAINSLSNHKQQIGFVVVSAGLESKLLVLANSLVADVESLKILIEDISSLINQAKEDSQLILPQKTGSYKSWVEFLNSEERKEGLLKEKDYWLKNTGGVQSLDLSSENGNYTLADEIFIGDFKRLNDAYGTETSELILTTLILACKEITGNTNLKLAVYRNGRNVFPSIELSRTIGCFISNFPLLLNISDKDDLSYCIKQVKETARAVPNEGFGFGMLINEVEELYANILANPPKIGFVFLENEPGLEVFGNKLYKEPLCIEVLQAANQLKIKYNYQNSADTLFVEHLLKTFLLTFDEVVAQCLRQDERELTPSDFTYKDISIEALEGINSLFNQ
jgi:amino acid adenylation domain-containing protein/non-ribosomal peptide synthase protein (TIGR01720 family)